MSNSSVSYRVPFTGDAGRVNRGSVVGARRIGDVRASRAESVAMPGLTRGGATRLDSVDMLRGLVIVLMVLDHVRDYFHIDALMFDPTDPARTTPLLFITRWVTHLCAPTFVFLAGVSIFLQRANGKDLATLTTFLLTRGLWLVLLETTLVAFGFNFSWPFLFLQVIWAIGVSMLLMSAIVRLPPNAVLMCAALIVCGHGMLAGVDAADVGPWALVWRLAMEPGPVGAFGLVMYPAIPWFGIMCLGYGLGSIFLEPAECRRRSLLIVGASAIYLFFVLRVINGFGDPAPWSIQHSSAATVFSFFRVTKYPPSLLYVLITLGIALPLCATLERLNGWLTRVLLAFGRTPLLTYVLHIYIAHGAALVIGVLNGVPAASFINIVGDHSRVEGAGWGFSLPVVYVIWIGVLAVLYPISAWFAAIKRRRRDWWLSYL